MEKNNLINNRSQPNLPITAPKYKNLFCNTSKNVGSYTHVLTIFIPRFKCNVFIYGIYFSNFNLFVCPFISGSSLMVEVTFTSKHLAREANGI